MLPRVTPSTASGKRIILATFGSPGDLQPFLAIGRELCQRGHDPTIATSEIYRDEVERAGLAFAPVRPNRLRGQQDPDFLDRLTKGIETPGEVFRQMFLPSMRESTEDLLQVVASADLVISHTLVAGGRLAAEARGVPWISAVMQPMGYLSSYEPPVVGPAWIAAFLRGAGLAPTRAMHRLTRGLTGMWAADWHALRAELGLAKVRDHPIWEGQHSLMRSLGLFPRALGAPQPDWPASARITGFPFYKRAGSGLGDDLRSFIEAGEPPLVFTLGTTAVNDPGRFYEESARAAIELGRRAILVAGPADCDRLNQISDNILAVAYAPHDLLFPHALAIIHQAGIGTLAEAMRAGKPMIIMPYGHDQADNAWRAKRLGVARILAKRKYRKCALVRELRSLILDSHARLSAARISQDVCREDGARSAATFIEMALD